MKMNRLSIRLGFWSALPCTATFVVFAWCFIAILLIKPLFLWTNFEDWVAFSRQNNQFFKYLAQLMMLLFGLLFVILVGTIYDYTQEEKKVLSRVSFGFAIVFSALVGIHYFLQISVVRLNVIQNNLVG